MEEIFMAVLELIAQDMPELSLVDEDYGQLETDEDTYPVTFPCALVGNMQADWGDTGLGQQQGVVTFTTRLAIDCYDDTHIGSGTTDKVKERLQMANKLYKTLQCFQPIDDMGPMFRVKSRNYSLPGGIKVYETMFQFEVVDKSAMT